MTASKAELMAIFCKCLYVKSLYIKCFFFLKAIESMVTSEALYAKQRDNAVAVVVVFAAKRDAAVKNHLNQLLKLVCFCVSYLLVSNFC